MTNKKRKTRRKRNRRTKRHGGANIALTLGAAKVAVKAQTSVAPKSFISRAVGTVTSAPSLLKQKINERTERLKVEKAEKIQKNTDATMAKFESKHTPVIETNSPISQGLSSIKALPKALPKELSNISIPEIPKLSPADIKEAVKEKLQIVTPLKAYPMAGFIIKNFIKYKLNEKLFSKIYNAAGELTNNKYKDKIQALNSKEKNIRENYQAACCLIYKYYYLKIAKYYSYLRNSDIIKFNCKDTKYMDIQNKLFNSIKDKDISDFDKIFFDIHIPNGDDGPFTKLLKGPKKSVTEMKEAIEDCFKVNVKSESGNIVNNYSYIILDLLHDMHYNLINPTEKPTFGKEGTCEQLNIEEECDAEDLAFDIIVDTI